MHAQPTTTVDLRRLVHDYFELTKPRVTLLAAFCALIGMLLASDDWVPWRVLVFGLGGISLLAGSGFTFNCLVERSIDARMARTRARASARGEVSIRQSADDVADLRHLRRLCGDLHRRAQAAPRRRTS
jgi:protoheme IX farnesyltransferase